MVDYAGIIKSSVPMQDVVERYTGQRPIRNRIRCPIHHGSDLNMRIYGKSYYCWVCHAAGDQIQFVQSVLGVSFRDAMIRLNEDFNLDLPIGTDGANRTDLSDLNRKVAERELAERMAQIDTVIDGTHRANLAGLFHTVELIYKELAPAPWDDEWREDWCEAARLRTELRYEVT